MPTQASRWRKHARQVLTRTLATIPEGTPPLKVRGLLSDAYPFGERHNHPYRIWLDELRRFMRPLLERACTTDDSPGYSLSCKAWLKVKCPYCLNRIKGGCLVCLRHHLELRALMDAPEWPAWRQALCDPEDAVTPLVLADWLGERQLYRLEAFFRGDHGTTEARTP